LVAGCGKKKDEERIVADAGDIKVTMADFYAAYNKISAPSRPDITTLEGKRRFANDLINKEILLAEGKRLGGITDAATVAQLDKALQGSLASLLYRNEIEAKTEVLGKDVADLYEKRKTGIKASHILVEDVPTAAKIREEIVSGKISFEDAARKYSLDQSSKNKGGELPIIQWGRTVPTFQKIAFELEPGKLSDPIETEFGVHLIRVQERIPQKIGTQEEMAPGLRQEVRRQKEQERMKEFIAQLEKNANLQWNEDGLNQLDQLIAANVGKDVDTIPAERQHIPDATEEQQKVVLATFSGKNWTIGDYIRSMQEVPPPNRPVTKLPRRGLRELIRTTQIDNELVLADAYAKGLDKNPEVKDKDSRIREQVIIEMVHARFLQEADVTEEEAKALFDSTMTANPEALKIPERVNMKVLVAGKPEVVREGLRRIRAGEPEGKVILELSEDMRTKGQGGETGLMARGSYAPQLEDVAFKRKPGSGWSEPIVTETGTGAIKVLAYEGPRVATFEEMKEPILQRLVQARGDKAFEEWLVKQRETLKIKIHDDVLALIGQPVSGGTAAAPSEEQGAPGAAPAPSAEQKDAAGNAKQDAAAPSTDAGGK
jgi:peptidyl-prolyl cis-trans isomerase C